MFPCSLEYIIANLFADCKSVCKFIFMVLVSTIMIKLNTKKQAIALFGDIYKLADAIGVTRQAIHFWPDRLTERQKNEVLGLAIRSGKIACQTDQAESKGDPAA